MPRMMPFYLRRQCSTAFITTLQTHFASLAPAMPVIINHDMHIRQPLEYPSM